MTDPCYLTMGIENGIIDDSQISFDNSSIPKSSVRFSSGIDASCPTIKHVLIDLGRIMTIKRIAFRSMTPITKITFDYGIKPGETLMPIDKSTRNNVEKRKYREMSYSGSGRIEYQNIDDWITVRYLRINLNQAACFQVELHGCAEVCSSYIKVDKLCSHQNSLINCSSLGHMRKVSFDHLVTLTGAQVEYSRDTPERIELNCVYDQDIITINVTSTIASKFTTFWFDKQYICDEIIIKSSCSSINFIGCNTGSMRKLGLEKNDPNIATLSAVGSVYETGLPPKNGYLHQGSTVYSGWISVPKPGKSWLKADFKNGFLVHGIALQGTGPNGHYATLEYTITFTYNGKFIDYESKKLIKSQLKNDLYRYLTDIHQFKTPFMANSIQINPEKCANFPGENWGCGVRWEILGNSRDSFPKPKIMDHGDNLECVSIYVSNSNNVSWTKNALLTEGIHYNILKETHNFQSDGYRRLNLTFLQPRKRMIPQYQQIGDDTNRRTLYYYVTFGCMAVFGNETIHREFNITEEFQEIPPAPYSIQLIDFNTKSEGRFAWKINTKGFVLQKMIYNITILNTNDEIVSYSDDVQTDELLVSGLKPLSNYTLKIQSKNKYAFSNTTSTATFITPGSRMPQNFSIKSTGIQSTTFSFDKPTFHVGNIVQYEIQCARKDTGYLTIALSPDNDTEICVTNLSPSTSYKCKIRTLVTSSKILGEWSKTISFSTFTDPCYLPLGVENGIIDDSRISFDNSSIPKSSVRFSSCINASCQTIRYVLIDLGRIMTIKGIAFRSMTPITKITFDYGIKPGETLMPIDKSARNNVEKRKYREMSYSGGSGSIEYQNIDDWITVRYLRVNLNQAACLQVELYGCAEVCSSMINISDNTHDGPQEQLNCTSLHGNRTISFDHYITITGVQVKYVPTQTKGIEIDCLNNNMISTLKYNTSIVTSTTTFWFDKQYICDAIVVKSSCYYIYFIGCNTGSMKKLGLEKNDPNIATLSAIGSVYETGYPPRNGYLHQGSTVFSGWVSVPNADTSWLKADFADTILAKGIALQGNGPSGHWATLEYTISYSYNTKKTLYSGNKIIKSQLKNNLYRYLTDIHQFKITFMANSIQINPKKCANFPGENWGCGVRWEILGNSKGNFPRPVIKDYGKKLECVSLYVHNANYLTWLPNNQSLVKGVHYWLNETSDYLSDGYRRLELRIKNKKLAGKFGVQGFDIVENMRYYYLTFSCTALFGNENVSREYNVTFSEKDEVPNAPISINVTYFNDGRMEMSWKVNTSDIYFNNQLSYHLSISKVDTDQLIGSFVDLHSMKVVLNRIESMTNYHLKIQSKNQFWFSETAIYPFTTTGSTKPINLIASVQKLQAKFSMTLKFSKPKFHVGLITRYQLKCVRDNMESIYESTTNNKTEITATNLIPFSVYKCKVRALVTTHNIYGDWSDEVDVATFIEGGPEWCDKSLNSNYTFDFNSQPSINLCIAGNPKPIMEVKFNGIKIENIQGLLINNQTTFYQYVYKFQLPKLQATQCGAELEYTASSVFKKGAVSRITGNSVIFVDDFSLDFTVQSVSDKDDKTIIKWSAIDSGKCIVKYYLQIGDGEDIMNIGPVYGDAYDVEDVKERISRVTMYAEYGRRKSLKTTLSVKSECSNQNIALASGTAIAGFVFGILMSVLAFVTVRRYNNKNQNNGKAEIQNSKNFQNYQEINGPKVSETAYEEPMALFKTNEYATLKKDLKDGNTSNYEIMETNAVNQKSEPNQYEMNAL